MVERLEKSFVNTSFNKYPCQFKFESIRSLKRRFLLCTNLRSGNPFLKHSGSFQFLCWPAFNYYCSFFLLSDAIEVIIDLKRIIISIFNHQRQFVNLFTNQ